MDNATFLTDIRLTSGVKAKFSCNFAPLRVLLPNPFSCHS